MQWIVIKETSERWSIHSRDIEGIYHKVAMLWSEKDAVELVNNANEAWHAKQS